MTILPSVLTPKQLSVHVDEYDPRRETAAVTVFSDKEASYSLASIVVNGPALRDVLLEAFPLEDGAVKAPSLLAQAYAPLAEWEQELLGIALPASFVTEPEPAVPGTVFEDRFDGIRRTFISDRLYFHSTLGVIDEHYPRDKNDALVFDPRDAPALPSPLGIRVGDKVKRTNEHTDHDVDVTRTVEFTVNHINESGTISSKYGYEYHPDGFVVTSRKVPDRLPAGTIVRWREEDGDLVLRKERGSVVLSGLNVGYEAPEGVIEVDVAAGLAEVIYLP